MTNSSRPVLSSGSLTAGIGVVAVLAITLAACARPDKQRRVITLFEANSGAVVAAIPPIDAEAPATTETATFALG